MTSERKVCPNCGHDTFRVVVENQDAIWVDIVGGTHYIKTIASGPYLEDEPIFCRECEWQLDWGELVLEKEEGEDE